MRGFVKPLPPRHESRFERRSHQSAARRSPAPATWGKSLAMRKNCGRYLLASTPVDS